MRPLEEIGRYEVPFLMDHTSDFPVLIRRAKGAQVWDIDHRKYTDLTSFFGVATIGHSDPYVIKAVREQLKLLAHGMGDVHPPAVKLEFLRLLSQKVGYEDFRYYVGLNGSDATDTALKVAYAVTGRPGVISFEGGYHGLYMGALRVTHREDFFGPFKGISGPRATFLSYPQKEEEAQEVLEEVQRLLATESIGAVIVELIQGRGGVRVGYPPFFKELQGLCRRYGAAFIVDEIFTGVYRTGPFLLSHEYGLEPDMILMGKGLGGGIPLSVTALAPRFWKGMGTSEGEAVHTATFVSHPLAMVAGIAVLQRAEALDLPSRAQKIERIMRKVFGLLPKGVLEVRGKGGFWGIELDSHWIAPMEVVGCLKHKGVLILPAGESGNVLEVVPPLVISRSELLTALEGIKECLESRNSL